MDAIIYLRDCISDVSCDTEENIQIDLDSRTLVFTKDSLTSQPFSLDANTPLLSSSNQPYTLYQLYLFTAYVKERDWADYIVDVGIAKQNPSNSACQILPIAESSNADCDQLYNYLKSTLHTHNGLHTPTSPPTPLKIIKSEPNKRKITDSPLKSSKSQPPIKRQKLESDLNTNSSHNISHTNIVELETNTDSLFTENYVSNINNIEPYIPNKPFWQTLPDPIPIQSLMNTADNTVDWAQDYRSRIRESSTRNTILNSLNNKSFGEIAKEFPKISRSLQKLRTNHNSNKNGHNPHITRVRLNQSEKIRKLRTEVPIIIVPYSNNSLLSFSNCLPFLQESKYIHCHNKALGGHSKGKGKSATRINLHKKSCLDVNGSKKAVFEIRSSSSFNKNTPPSEWLRVSAIFVIGKKWQFKKWVQGWQKPEEIFSKACGFYMHFKDDLQNEVVKNWRVNYLTITRNARHDDARIAKQFWDKLYSHLKKHKNKKLFF